MPGVHRMLRSFSVMLVIAVLMCAGAVRAEDATAGANTLEELGRIAKVYQFEIVTAGERFPVKSTYGVIDGQNAERTALDRYVDLFAPEFTLYPADLVKRSQLKRIVLCQKLSFAGQLRNAIPDYEHDTLYLEVDRGAYNKGYLRKVIHHEFFHIIDYRDDGRVYQDDPWGELNPPKFQYGKGGRNVQDINTTSVLTDKFPGFLNHYSTTGVEEDKAEIFANLIVEAAHVQARAKRDAVLKAKVERMKELLVTFSPEMNEKFWEQAGKLPRADEAPTPKRSR